jgi:hypothetical protein
MNMPKEKEIGLNLIAKVYRKNSESIALFFWVLAQRNIIPTITIRESVEKFLKFTGIDGWDTESALVTYNRLLNDFLNEK